MSTFPRVQKPDFETDLKGWITPRPFGSLTTILDFLAISVAAFVMKKLMQRESFFRGEQKSPLLFNINNVKCILLPTLGADYIFLSFVQANMLGIILDSAWGWFFVHSASFPMVSLLMGDY